MNYEIVPRSGWAARAPDHRILISTLPTPELWIHHTANAAPGDYQEIASEEARMRAIQAFHMDSKGWSDIAYSFVIFDSGRIYEGRGWGVAGGHTCGRNTISHGICFDGNFQTELPTLAALDGCRWLMNEGKEGNFLKPTGIPTGGHRDADQMLPRPPGCDSTGTVCPGNNLYQQLGYLEQPWTEPVEGGLFMHLKESEEKEILEAARWQNANKVRIGKFFDYIRDGSPSDDDDDAETGPYAETGKGIAMLAADRLHPEPEPEA